MSIRRERVCPYQAAMRCTKREAICLLGRKRLQDRRFNGKKQRLRTSRVWKGEETQSNKLFFCGYIFGVYVQEERFSKW